MPLYEGISIGDEPKVIVIDIGAAYTKYVVLCMFLFPLIFSFKSNGTSPFAFCNFIAAEVSMQF